MSRRKKWRKKDIHYLFIFLAVCMIGVGVFLTVVSLMDLQRKEEERQQEESYAEMAGKLEEIAAEETHNDLEIHFIDVGQGDAALLRYRDHAAMIDVGSSSAGKTDIVGYLEEQGISELEYLIFSHGHEDHIGASYEIFWKSDIAVRNAVCNFGNEEDGNVVMVVNSLLEKQIPVLETTEGTTFEMGDVKFEIVMGREPGLQSEDAKEYENEIQRTQQQITDVNNQSLAVLVTYGENTFLFYGDGEETYEKLLRQKWGNRNPVTLLKAPHHGGAVSSSDEILDVICPQNVVISSAAPEQHGFPDQETLERYEKRRIPYYCTYQLGTIVVKSNGKEIEFIMHEE